MNIAKVQPILSRSDGKPLSVRISWYGSLQEVQVPIVVQTTYKEQNTHTHTHVRMHTYVMFRPDRLS